MISKEYTDYLVHRDHKYIDRYKGKNGKWVYVYKEAVNSAKKAARTVKDVPNHVAVSKTGWFPGEKGIYYDYKNGDGWSDKVGVTVNGTKGNEYIRAFNTKNSKYWDDDETYTKKNLGPVSAEYAEDGVSYKLDVSGAANAARKAKEASAKTVGKGKNYVQKLLKLK